MRYRELFERNNQDIIDKLKFLINHPNTEETVKRAAIEKLKSLSPKPTPLDPLATVYNRHGQMQRPGLKTQPKKF